jgi:hypothetical protein
MAQDMNGTTSFTTFREDRSLNVPNTGIMSETSMTFDTNPGMAGASYGLYGIARGKGSVGTWGVHDIVGVYGTAYKDFNGWAAGGHFDCYDSVPGGTCLGVNIELPKTQKGSETIGLNIQPNVDARGIVGIQLQNPQTYKYGVIAANTSYVFGMTNDVPFGFRFNSATQRLEFFRNIGQPNETRRGWIDMNFEAHDSRLNN